MRISSRAGFTVLETVVAISIMLAFAATAMVVVRRGALERAVRQEAQLAALMLREAQAKAASSIPFQDQIPFGYGVVFSSTGQNDRFVLFADLEFGDDMTYVPANDEFISERRMAQRVIIQGVEVCDDPNLTTCNAGLWVAHSELTVFFCPPNPNTFLYDESQIFNPDPNFSGRGESCLRNSSFPYAQARVIFSRGATQLTLRINATGAIFLEP